MKGPLTKTMKFIKYLIFVFNLLFLVCGLTLIAVGVIVNIQFREFFDFSGDNYIGYLALFVIVIGAVVALISFFGCCGGFKESRCMVIAFSTFLVVIFLCEIALIFTGFALKDRLYSLLQNDMLKSMNSTKPGVLKAWDFAQQEFNCCGLNGASDWKIRFEYAKYLPRSCCNDKYNEPCPTATNPAYSIGCLSSIEQWIGNNLLIISCTSLVLILIQIFALTLSCLLARSIKRGYEIVSH